VLHPLLLLLLPLLLQLDVPASSDIKYWPLLHSTTRLYPFRHCNKALLHMFCCQRKRDS
jgi:hypothetical protein